MNTKTMLMNPCTGSVASEKEWKEDAKTDSWNYDEAELIEVEKDENDDWIEVLNKE